MKISVFIMCLCIGSVSAKSSYSQSTMFTLELRNKALKDIFSEIEKQSEYIFFYNNEAVDTEEEINVSVDNATIYEVLDNVLDKRKSNYKVINRQVILYKQEVTEEDITATPEVETVEQSRHSVTGKIISEKGEELIGVSVLEKGTTNGTITNIDGRFTLSVNNANAVLVFSYIGYESQDVSVAGKNTLNITLKEEAASLDEVIVVGYGTQRRSSITGAIAPVDVNKMKAITTPGVANMLQGKVAGVVVTPLSGQPGEGVSIRVRGIGSIRGNQSPLWVIDGVVGDAVAELNPNDIEAISVLKDGSATALYGSRGANGVVLVTTKRGTTGTSQMEVSARLGVSELQKGKLRMMNGAEYYDYVKTALDNAGVEQDWLQPYLANQNTDWWDISTQSALTQNYNIGYRFGNEKIKSYLSGDYYNEEGTIKGFDYDRYTIRANTDFIVNKRLTIKSKISFSYRETYNQEHSLSYYSYTPWDTPYDSQGNLKDGSQGLPTTAEAATADPRDYWYSDGGSNFLYDRHLNWSRVRRNATDLGIGLDYKIFDFLTFESNNKFAFSNYYRDKYVDPASRGGQAKNGTIESYNTNDRFIYTSQMLRFLKTFAERHEVNAYLGYDYDEKISWNNTGESSNIFPGNEVLSGGVSDHLVKGGKSERKNAAWFFNGNYAYDGKYLFQVSYRYDGSSLFGSSKRWASFWSVGAGWNMHEEEFVKQFDFINELKPRISYGIVGNQPEGAYEWTTKFDTTKEYGGNVAFMTNYSGNPNLSWEETKSLDVGVDMRLFNRVNITFDYYSKKVKNLLYLRHLSAVTGFNRQTANDGKLENNGVEFTITPEIIKTKDLYWDVSFNLGYNKNKVTYLPDGNSLAQQSTAVGYPYRNWYMREWAGVDPMNGDPLWFIVNEETGEKTATNVYNEATPVLLNASPTPKYNGAISTSIAWKGFSLNANFTFSAGAKIYNGKRAGSVDRDGTRISQPAMRLADGWSRWEKPGDIATHPKLIYGGNKNSSGESTRYLERADYFKLKTITLAYNVPKKWLAPLGVSDMNISLGGENLFTITEYSGDDPEILLSSRYNGTTSNSSYQLYPTVRRFTLGLNLKF